MCQGYINVFKFALFLAPPPILTGSSSFASARDAAEILGTTDGTFLVRSTGKVGVYALGVVFKGKATHHKLLLDPETATYKVNQKPFGSHTTLASMIKHLGTPGVKGWPVPLTTPVNAGAGDGGDGGGGIGSHERGFPWLHSAMNKNDAEAHLTSLGNNNGQFVVRGKPGKQLLSVVYKGKPTHHKIEDNGEGSLVINKKQYG